MTMTRDEELDRILGKQQSYSVTEDEYSDHRMLLLTVYFAEHGHEMPDEDYDICCEVFENTFDLSSV